MATPYFSQSLRALFAPRTRRGSRILVAVSAVLFGLLLVHLVSQPVPGSIFSFGAREKDKDIYYERDTPLEFPPSSPDSKDYCANFPAKVQDDIQLTLKTGIGEIDRAEAHLAGASSCFKNVIVVGDIDRQLEGHHLIDIIADLPQSYHVKNPDLEIYTKQKEAIEKGDSVGYSKDAWRLDRFKFLPMVERAYKTNPTAKWYVFSEADNYIFWDPMLRMLYQFDPRERLYFGSAVHSGGGIDFAYGGAAFVMSHALMKDFVEGHDVSPTAEFEAMAREDCCGDSALAHAIFNKTGVRVKGVYPMFSGDDIYSMPLDAEKWCGAIITLHRAQPWVTAGLWHWERTRPYTRQHLVWADLLHYTHPWLRNETVREHWDNLSDVSPSLFSGASQSPKHCAESCHRDAKCLQYRYAKGRCRFGNELKLGFSTKEADGEFTSGWDMEKIRALGFDPEDNSKSPCDRPMWRKPHKTP